MGGTCSASSHRLVLEIGSEGQNVLRSCKRLSALGSDGGDAFHRHTDYFRGVVCGWPLVPSEHRHLRITHVGSAPRVKPINMTLSKIFGDPHLYTPSFSALTCRLEPTSIEHVASKQKSVCTAECSDMALLPLGDICRIFNLSLGAAAKVYKR